jgi:hypothetical protein
VPTTSKLYLTYRSEYLVLGDLCVGVRDRSSGTWLSLHTAACAQVLGPIATSDNMLPAARLRVGDRLCLYAAARRVVTGPIVAIEAAKPALLEDAERQWKGLFSPSDPNHTAIVMAR